MRYKIYAKNLVLTPALRIYIEEKIIRPVELRMKKAAESDLPILEVGISRTTEHHRKGKVYHAEVNLRIGSKLLRAVADDQDPRTAIDLKKKKMGGNLMLLREKRRAGGRRGARRVKKEMHLARSARIRRGS